MLSGPIGRVSPSDPGPSAPGARPVLDVGLFNFLWGIGILLHFAYSGRNYELQSVTGYAAATGAALLVVRPRSSAVWALAAVTQLSDVLHATFTIERLANSWLTVALVHVIVLTALFRQRHRPAAERSQATMASIVPTLRGLVLVMYFWASFHKLNAGYFAPSNPHALKFLERMGSWFDASAMLSREQAAVLGILTEGTILLLLVIPRARVLGVLMAIGLHGSLGYAGFHQFGIMFPLLLTFLWGVPTSGRPLEARPAALLFVPAVIALLSFGEPFLTHQTARDGYWTVLVLFVLAAVVRRIRAHGLLEAGRVRVLEVKPRQLLVPAVLAAWCCLPYLGVTSHPALAMYSQLEVYAGTSNHFIVPAGLQIDAIQDDLVGIVRSTTRKYPLGAKIPRLALRKSLYKDVRRGNAPRRVSWMEDGVKIRFRRGEAFEWGLAERVPYLSFNGPAALLNARRDAKRELRRRRREQEDRPLIEAKPRGGSD